MCDKIIEIASELNADCSAFLRDLMPCFHVNFSNVLIINELRTRGKQHLFGAR